MDTVMTLAAATHAALMRDYYLWLAILAIVLAFAIYVKLFPQSIDFFDNPDANSKKRVTPRVEPPEDDPHVNHTPVHED